MDLPNITLNKWELKILAILERPPALRTIYWIYDKVGGKGKTTFCRWLCVHNDFKDKVYFFT